MGAMSQESMDKNVNYHFMYEATDDIEGVLRTFTEDAEHEVIGGPTVLFYSTWSGGLT